MCGSAGQMSFGQRLTGVQVIDNRNPLWNNSNDLQRVTMWAGIKGGTVQGWREIPLPFGSGSV